MGFNSAIFILNDRLGIAEKDPEGFGKAIIRAIQVHGYNQPNPLIGFGAECFHCQHADGNNLYLLGGNTVRKLPGYAFTARHVPDEELNLAILKDFADKMGFRLVKKSVKKETA